jgi:hypothetical protein
LSSSFSLISIRSQASLPFVAHIKAPSFAMGFGDNYGAGDRLLPPCIAPSSLAPDFQLSPNTTLLDQW